MATYTDALFIKADDNGLLAYIEQNYDQNQIRQLIVDTQNYRIKPLIGTGLYDELVTQITNNTLTSLNTTLLGYIRHTLIFYVLTDGVEIFNYKIRNKGVMTTNSDNGAPVDLNVLDRLMRYFEDRAQEYGKRMERYLLQNVNSYPLFLNPGTGIDTIIPRPQNRSTGWYLGTGDFNDDYAWIKYYQQIRNGQI